MKIQDLRSKCCNTEVTGNGIPDFIGSTEIVTLNFSCTKCGKRCDVTPPKLQKKKKEISDIEKRIQTNIERLDFHGKILKELLNFFEGITIDSKKRVILTPEKKRQLAKLKLMEKRLRKGKTKKIRK